MPRRGLAGEPELACRVLECPHPVAACAGQYSWTAHERMPRTSLQAGIPRKENEGDPARANGVEGEGAVEHLFQGESRVELDAY